MPQLMDARSFRSPLLAKISRSIDLQTMGTDPTRAYASRFDRLFETATGFRPYEYQVRLACGDHSARGSEDRMGISSACESMLIDVPTGFGKTSAVVLAWLWNRIIQRRGDWPRRLVYCLPMRTLVEQTFQNAHQWLDRLDLPNPIGLHMLMGGEDAGKWDINAVGNAVLVGTQDMLLSRALNRGYGMSQYRWPMHFGLLNNDCLWVMDEVQLMGPGLWTSAQLDWMRQDRFKSLKPCLTWWMSATIDSKFLETLDRKNATWLPMPRTICLGKRDQTHKIFQARRPCQRWPRGGAQRAGENEQALAQAVIDDHKESSLSLVVCNTVSRAQKVYRAIRDIYSGTSDIVLLTSRFRVKDRKGNQGKLLDFEAKRKHAVTDESVSVKGVICVSTQVIEAGVDISARRLWSEIAPWPSIIQRLGRLNRDGHLDGDAKAYFWESENLTQSKFVGPYEVEALKLGRELISKLIAACQTEKTLTAMEALNKLSVQNTTKNMVKEALTPSPEPCPRAIDVHGLFSTEPDVFGGFTDVSPFVRGQDMNADVTVFWRKWHSSAELRQLTGPAFVRKEGCPVSVGKLREFLGREDWGSARIWDDKREAWESVRAVDIRPGMLVMLQQTDGGYSRELGWTGNKTDQLELGDVLPPGVPHEKFEDDCFSESGVWVTLADHLKDAEREAAHIVQTLNLNNDIGSAIVHASSEHDIGKALPQWQDKLPKLPPQEGGVWAKMPCQFAIIANDSATAREVEKILREKGVRHNKADPWRQEDTSSRVRFTWHTASKVSSEILERIRTTPGIGRAWNVPFRPGFRHEAATALALWHSYYREASGHFSALSIYLSAAHHGKVRTVLTSRTATGEDVCGIPKTTTTLPWNSMPLDFACAVDGASGRFSDDGREFFLEAPGWTGLVADLLGAWEAEIEEGINGAVPGGEPRNLGPFVLAYLEALVRCADERASSAPSTKVGIGS